MNTSTKSVGIGCGARLRRVVELLLKEAPVRIKVKAIYDPDPLSQSAALSTFGLDVECYATESELAAHPGVDWVFIGSPNQHHSRQAVLALHAAKNVFCEKPLATSEEDSLAVREAVLESGRIFAFGLVLRYSAHYQKVRELVQSGVIGELISFEFNETFSFIHRTSIFFGNWLCRRACWWRYCNAPMSGAHLVPRRDAAGNGGRRDSCRTHRLPDRRSNGCQNYRPGAVDIDMPRSFGPPEASRPKQ